MWTRAEHAYSIREWRRMHAKTNNAIMQPAAIHLTLQLQRFFLFDRAAEIGRNSPVDFPEACLAAGGFQGQSR